MKKLLVYALITFAMITSLSKSTHAKDIKPFIHSDGYIQLASKWGLCGGLLITPIIANIEADEGFSAAQLRLRAVRYKSEYTPQKEVGRVILKPEGLRAAYRWGMAFRPDSHYRIFCEKVNITHGGKEIAQPINCKDVVTISRIRHDRPCVVGPAGPGGSFEPLGMK